MNNVGFFEAIWLYIWNFIKNSVTYKFLKGVYDGISKAWQNSAITSWFRREHFSENALGSSIAGKIFRFPFTITEKIREKYGERLSLAIEKSGIISLCRSYTHNLLAVNLRFIGVLHTFFGIGMSIAKQSAGVLEISMIVAGVIYFIIDGNVTDWFKNSVVVKFVCNCFGIETDFKWYDESLTNGRGRLILGGVVGVISGMVGGLVSPVLGIALAIGLFGIFLVLEKAEAGLFALVFLAPIAPTMVMAGLSILCIFSLVMKSILEKDFKWKFDGVGFLILVFIAIYLFSGITSFAMVKSLSIWAIYAVFMAAYFLVINLIKNKKQLRNLLTLFVLSGTFVCLYGIAQYIFGWDINQAWMDEEMFGDIKMRIYSTLENPNVLGEYILLVLPVAVGLMFTREGVLQKVVYSGIIAMMFLALILTFSRGCWIGIIFAAAIFVTFAAGKLWGLGIIALPIIPMVLPESIMNRFMSIGDMKDSSTSYRVYIWMGTLAMVKDFWVSGIGMGAEAFKEVYPFYSYNGIVAPHAHNLFLQILVESGIGGIVVFLGILIFFLKRMMVNYKYGGGKGSELSTMMVALVAGICGFLLQGMFDNCFYNYRVLLVFWYVIGIAMACGYVAKNIYEEEAKN